MKLISSFAAGAFALLALTSAALAQPGNTEARKFGEFWVVRCLPVQNASPCDMYQEVLNGQTGQRYVTMSLAYVPSADRYIMVISVPLGVLIGKGAEIQTSTFSTGSMPIRRCDRGGCYVEVGVAKGLVEGLSKTSGEGKIKMVGDDDKPYEFPLQFSGFGDAHVYMVEQNRAKARTPSATGAAPSAAPAPAP